MDIVHMLSVCGWLGNGEEPVVQMCGAVREQVGPHAGWSPSLEALLHLISCPACSGTLAHGFMKPHQGPRGAFAPPLRTRVLDARARTYTSQ